MNNLLSFGKYKGKSFEWLFFKAPWYIEYIRRNGIHRQRHAFSEEEEEHFDELFYRASHLTSLCRWCQQRPVTSMALSTHHGSGALGAIGFYCDECEYTGGSPTDYYEPSFFMPYKAPDCEQLRLTAYIKNRYLGSSGNLTQKKMEEFFHDNANFVHPTPRFFTAQMTDAALI